MKTAAMLSTTEGAIWGRIVDPTTGDLMRGAAQALLRFDFQPGDRARMEELAEKAGAGTLTSRERKEAETFNRVAHLLALLQSKARRSLGRTGKRH
jgi:hypothetical protein